jgi:regulatory protein
MDSGENVQIERLVRQKRGRPGEEIEVLLSDASSFFAALKSWQQKPFHEGDTLNPDAVARLREESAMISVRARAMSLLARADHSAFLLRQKLVSRGHESHVVIAVLADLVDTGMVDDGRFSESWTRDRVRRHPEGRSVLIAGLRQRGVSAETAETAVSGVLADEEFSPEDAIQRLAQRFFRARGATPESVSSKLYRRGFPSSLVRRVIGELTGTDSVEPEE